MGLSAYGSLEEGKTANKMAKIQSSNLENESKATRMAGQSEMLEKQKEGARLQATQIAQMNAQGGTMTGSNLLTLATTAKEIEADAMMIERNYRMNANTLNSNAALTRWQGKNALRASRIRATADGLQSAAMLFAAAGGGGGGGGKTGIGEGGSKAGTGSASKGWSANNNFGKGMNRNF